MKMKKMMFNFVMGLTVLLVSGCGSNPKEEFLKEMNASAASKEYNAGKFEMGFEEITLHTKESLEANERLAMNMVTNQLKDIKITGDYSTDKDFNYKVAVNMDLVGQKIPFQLVGNKDQLYLSTDVLFSLLDLAEDFDAEIPFQRSDLKELEKKYVNMTDLGNSLAEQVNTDTTHSFKAESFDTEQYRKTLEEWFQTLDEATFKKDKDELTHTFTKKEMGQLIKIVMKSLPEVSEDEIGKDQLDKYSKMIEEAYEEYSIKMTINSRTKAIKMKTTMAIADQKQQENNVKVVMNLAMTPQKTKETIKLPTEKNILTESQIEGVMVSIEGNK